MIDHSLVTGFTMFIRRSFDMTCFGISTYHRHEPPLALVFSAGLGGKDESADRAESRPRSTMVPAKFPGYIEPGDVQNTITPMFGGNMYENSCNVSTTLWSPDPESFSGLRKRKSDCAPEYAPRARSPIG